MRKKKEKARERERESPRERTRASSEESTPREEGPPHKISNLLVLDPRRERERERDRIENNRFRSYRVLPGSHDNL